MKYAYWCIEALLGVALVVAPIVERFTAFHRASYTDVILGAALIVWALVGYDMMNHNLFGIHRFTRA